MTLTESNYFSPEAELYYMGSTQFKRFQQCESQALAIIRGEYVPETSTALLVGSYVDAHFSRTLDIFKAQHPEIFKRDGGLKAEYEHANNIIARIEREPLMVAALSGQSQVIMTGTIENIPFKIKIDSMLPTETNDLKIMKDFGSVWSDEDGCRLPWWKAWRYDIGGTIYQTVRAQNDGGLFKPLGLVAASKETPEPDVGMFRFGQSVLDATMDEIRVNVVYFDGLKKGLFEPEPCGKCAWCRSQKTLTGWEELTA